MIIVDFSTIQCTVCHSCRSKCTCNTSKKTKTRPIDLETCHRSSFRFRVCKALAFAFLKCTSESSLEEMIVCLTPLLFACPLKRPLSSSLSHSCKQNPSRRNITHHYYSSLEISSISDYSVEHGSVALRLASLMGCRQTVLIHAKKWCRLLTCKGRRVCRCRRPAEWYLDKLDNVGALADYRPSSITIPQFVKMDLQVKAYITSRMRCTALRTKSSARGRLCNPVERTFYGIRWLAWDRD